MTTELSLYNADKDLFGRLYIDANTLQSIWKKLRAMSCPQFHAHSHNKIAACEKLITYSILVTNVVEHLVRFGRKWWFRLRPRFHAGP